MSHIQGFDADTTYSTSDIAVGGGGGLTFYVGGVKRGMKPATGRSVQSLKFFYGEANRIRGFEIKLTDGIHTIVGNDSTRATETFHFAEGEKVSSLKVWADNHETGRCGRIELITDRNRPFTVESAKNGDPYVYEIGSGTLAGVFGKFGLELDCLRFSLLDPS